jgi:hypothetical protein
MYTSWIPFLRSHFNSSSSTGFDPTGISGFGSMVVYGRKRIPFPPDWITAFILSLRDPITRVSSGVIGRVIIAASLCGQTSKSMCIG